MQKEYEESKEDKDKDIGGEDSVEDLIEEVLKGLCDEVVSSTNRDGDIQDVDGGLYEEEGEKDSSDRDGDMQEINGGLYDDGAGGGGI